MNAHRWKKLLAALLAALMLALLAGCGGTSSESAGKDGSLQKVLDAGELILGLDMGFPPMGFVDEKGEIVGFDIDVAQEVCNRLGVKLVKQGINWDEKEEDLNNGVIDCIWNGFSVTPGRAEAMDLSEPYMKNELIVVVPGGSEAKVLRDLKGMKIGVQAGSTAQEVLEASELAPDITIVKFEDILVMLDELKAGEVEAALVDSVAAYYYIFSTEGQYYILSESLGEEEYAIGFRKGDQALRDKIQEIIIEMKTDGTLAQISTKWFGSDITTVR